jgi:hypothetical protein
MLLRERPRYEARVWLLRERSNTMNKYADRDQGFGSVTTYIPAPVKGMHTSPQAIPYLRLSRAFV